MIVCLHRMLAMFAIHGTHSLLEMSINAMRNKWRTLSHLYIDVLDRDLCVCVAVICDAASFTTGCGRALMYCC